MDVLHDAYFHTEDNYKCMTSSEELSKSSQNKDWLHDLIEKLYSSPHCKYQSGKYKKFIEKSNYKLEPPSSKK